MEVCLSWSVLQCNCHVDRVVHTTVVPLIHVLGSVLFHQISSKVIENVNEYKKILLYSRL